MDLTLTDIINNATSLIVFATPVAIVLFVFFWNLAMLTFQSANPEKLKQARARIFWSIVAMFVVFSLAGILSLLQLTFFGSSTQQNTLPTQDSVRTILPDRAGPGDLQCPPGSDPSDCTDV